MQAEYTRDLWDVRHPRDKCTTELETCKTVHHPVLPTNKPDPADERWMFGETNCRIVYGQSTLFLHFSYHSLSTSDTFKSKKKYI